MIHSSLPSYKEGLAFRFRFWISDSEHNETIFILCRRGRQRGRRRTRRRRSRGSLSYLVVVRNFPNVRQTPLLSVYRRSGPQRVDRLQRSVKGLLVNCHFLGWAFSLFADIVSLGRRRFIVSTDAFQTTVAHCGKGASPKTNGKGRYPSIETWKSIMTHQQERSRWFLSWCSTTPVWSELLEHAHRAQLLPSSQGKLCPTAADNRVQWRLLRSSQGGTSGLAWGLRIVGGEQIAVFTPFENKVFCLSKNHDSHESWEQMTTHKTKRAMHMKSRSTLENKRLLVITRRRCWCPSCSISQSQIRQQWRWACKLSPPPPPLSLSLSLSLSLQSPGTFSNVNRDSPSRSVYHCRWSWNVSWISRHC